MTETKPSSTTQQSLSELFARPAAVEILVFAAAVLAFFASVGFQFAYDDRFQIVDNPAITSWRGVLAYFTSGVWTGYAVVDVQNYYRPLFFVWFRLNYLAFHLHPAGWHAMAVSLHAVASVLAFRVLLRMTGQSFVSAVAALLFAVHPIHIESVAWISGTTDPLMCIFLFGSLLFFLRWMEQGGARPLAASTVLFGLSLLCKEPALMLLPFLAFWVCIAPGIKSSRPRVLLRGLAPMVVVTAIYGVARVHALHGAAHSIHPLSLAQVLLTLPSLVYFYLRQSLLPVGLSFAYQLRAQDSATLESFWIPLLSVLGVAALFAVWWRRAGEYRTTLLVAAGFWVTWMLLVWNPRWLPLEELVHDRYLYLPVLGICMAVGVALAQWRDALAGEKKMEAAMEASMAGPEAAGDDAKTQPLIPAAARPVVTAAALAVLLLAATFSQSLDCASDLLIWSRAYRVAPNSIVALTNFGTVLFERGRMEEGSILMQRALHRNPASYMANYNMAYALHNAHNDRAAEPYAVNAVTFSHRSAPALRLLGTVELNLGRSESAEQLLREAVSRAPQGEGFHLALAIVLLQRGDRAAAERETLAELNLFPQSGLARQVLEQLRHSTH